ncbi:ABC transporter substrate-binding protein [Demequina sediminicola]|uniref:ABC transporter substrate-binding protein n=1 Tax=Demequina sediminicola TaxID=1095026 RepID=UPI00078243A6|nr:ABC transporter substrate-binding protein [Demequina sediminicola]
MARKHVAIAAFALTASLTLAACSAATEEADAAASQGESSTPTVSTDTINTELFSAPTQFDPAIASGSASVSAARLGFDTLLRASDEGYVGGIASEWEAQSATDYVLTIRDDATCSDGSVIDSQVVADSLTYLTTVDDAAAQAITAQAFGTGTPTFTAEGDSLAISLSEPYSAVLAGLTLENTGIICPAGLDDLDGLAAGTVEGAWSGPYTLSDSNPGVSATYSLRDDYAAWPYELEGVPAATINITVAADSTTSANLLQSGGVDVTRFYDSNALQFTESDDYSYETTNASAYSLVFNQTEGSGSVFIDAPELRAAAASAVSREGFNEAALDGLGTPLTSITYTQSECVNDDEALLQAYDPEAAAADLDGVTIRLLTMSNWDAATDYMSESLRAAGATVEVTALDPADWRAAQRAEKGIWDVTLVADGNTTGIVSLSLERVMGPLSEDGGSNITGKVNDVADAALAFSMTSDDEDAACSSLLEAQESVLQDVAFAPLISDTHYIVSRAGFSSPIIAGNWDLTAMRVTE